jgi:hypothetical protein
VVIRTADMGHTTEAPAVEITSKKGLTMGADRASQTEHVEPILNMRLMDVVAVHTQASGAKSHAFSVRDLSWTQRPAPSCYWTRWIRRLPPACNNSTAIHDVKDDGTAA